MRAELTIAALTMAIQKQKRHNGLIHHSGRGRQDAAAKYRELIKAANPEKEIAPIESCFGVLKTELFYQTSFPARVAANESCLPLSKDTIIDSGGSSPPQSKLSEKRLKSGVQ